MSEQKPIIQIREDEIPDVLAKDRLPVLKTMIAARHELDESVTPQFELLENTIDSILNRRINQLADSIESHFNSLDDAGTSLSPSAIGRELANAVRAYMPAQDQEENEANRLQYSLFSDLHGDKLTK